MDITPATKHIICFSGGHSSGLVAIEAVRKCGKENVILLNHNINPTKEHADIKRFKIEVAAYLGIPITYANIDGIEDENLIPDQFEVCIKAGAFKQPGTGKALCTAKLKTEPFNEYVQKYHPDKNCIVYYGFDDDEQDRIQRREYILGQQGLQTDFPIARWLTTIEATEDIGILRPLTYEYFKHGNCVGCLKGGIQHWYVTYCHRYDVFCDGKKAEAIMGYSILKDQRTIPNKPLYLKDLEEVFKRMKCEGVPQSEHFPEKKFQKYLKKYRLPKLELFAPCECSF